MAVDFSTFNNKIPSNGTIQQGRPIMNTNGDDLAEFAGTLQYAYSINSRDSFQAGYYPDVSLFDIDVTESYPYRTIYLNPSATETEGTWETFAEGYINLPPLDPVTFLISVFGRDVNVRVTVGGVTSSSIASDTDDYPDWTFDVFEPSGVTRDSNGWVLVTVEVQQVSAPSGDEPALWTVAMGEDSVDAADLPDRDAADSQGRFQAMDLDAYNTDDDSIDGFLFQELTKNTNGMQIARSKSSAYFYPYQDPYKISSCRRRACGPYYHVSGPGEETVDVVLKVSADTQPVRITAFSELELDKYYDIWDLPVDGGRAQTITTGSGEQKIRFSGIPVHQSAHSGVSAKPTAIYIGIHSTIGPEKAYSPLTVDAFRDPGDQVVEVSGNLTGEENMVYGLCAKILPTEPDPNAGDETAAEYQSIYHDVGWVGGTGFQDHVRLSPYPSLPASVGTTKTEMGFYECGVLSIYSYSIRGEVPELTTTELQAASQVADPARSAQVGKTLSAIRASIVDGCPMICSRHPGEGWMKGKGVTSSGATPDYNGRFALAGSDPGRSGGAGYGYPRHRLGWAVSHIDRHSFLNAMQIYAGALLIAFRQSENQNPDPLPVKLYISTDGTPTEPASTDYIVEVSLPVYTPGMSSMNLSDTHNPSQRVYNAAVASIVHGTFTQQLHEVGNLRDLHSLWYHVRDIPVEPTGDDNFTDGDHVYTLWIAPNEDDDLLWNKYRVVCASSYFYYGPRSW